MLLAKIIAVFFSVVCLSLPAYADADDMSKLIQLLSFKQYSADFKQQTFDDKKQLLQSMQGVIRLQKPNQFYWQSNQPYAQKLIGNGEKIWHYDEDLMQVSVQDYKKQLNNAPILLILKDTATLEQRFQLFSVKTEQAEKIYSLKPLQQESGTEQIQLRFKNGVLQGLYFVDHLHQATQVQFSHIQTKQSIAPAIFDFVIPEGADVVYE